MKKSRRGMKAGSKYEDAMKKMAGNEHMKESKRTAHILC